jgi:hypothetical protein
MKAPPKTSWFSEDCEKFCVMADSALVNMLQRLFAGSVTLQEMETIIRKKSQVEKLCEANAQYSLSDVKSILEHRNGECVAFRHHKEVLGSFCRELEAYNLSIQGMILDIHFS